MSDSVESNYLCDACLEPAYRCKCKPIRCEADLKKWQQQIEENTRRRKILEEGVERIEAERARTKK